MKLGERLRMARKAAKLTQAELSRKVGITQPTLSDIENGNITSTTVVVELARATGVSSSWLAEERGDMYGEGASLIKNDGGTAYPLSPSGDWVWGSAEPDLVVQTPSGETTVIQAKIYAKSGQPKLAKLFEALTEAYKETALSKATFELMMTALHAELEAIPDREMAPIRQILLTFIDLRQTSQGGVNESSSETASEAELDRRAREASAGAIPGETESGNARVASGGAQRQRR